MTPLSFFLSLPSPPFCLIFDPFPKYKTHWPEICSFVLPHKEITGVGSQIQWNSAIEVVRLYRLLKNRKKEIKTKQMVSVQESILPNFFQKKIFGIRYIFDKVVDGEFVVGSNSGSPLFNPQYLKWVSSFQRNVDFLQSEKIFLGGSRI